MVKRETFLAKIDQDVAGATETINSIVKEYAEKLAGLRTGEDEADVITGLAHYLLNAHLPQAYVDRGFDRETVLSAYLAVAVKMIREARTS